MTDIWLILAVTFSGLMLIYKNKIDLFLVFYLSNFLYHHGIILNYINTGAFNEAPTQTSRAIVALVFTSLFLVQVGERFLPKKARSTNSEIVLISNCQFARLATSFLIISIFSTLLFIYSAGAGIFDNKAVSKQSAIPFSFVGSYYFAYASSGYFFLAKRNFAFALTLLIIVFYLFVGTRAFAVLFIINLVLIASTDIKLFSKRNFKRLFLLILIFAFFAVYKHLYIALKALEFSQLMQLIFTINSDKLIRMLFSAEWSQISMNLSRITLLENKDLFDFWDMLVMSLPGFNSWSTLPERFSEVIYYHANPGYTYGLGGAFWGEIWYVFGFLGVFVFSQLVLWYLAYCNSLLYFSVQKYFYHAPLIVFVAFYLPRNDVAMLIASFKNLLLSLVLGFILVQLVIWRVRKRRRKVCL